MLMVFLIDFPAALTPGSCRVFGSGEVGLLPPGVGVVGSESCECEGARSPLLGRFGVEVDDLNSDDIVGIPPVLLRVFWVGNAGKAAVGGPYEGLEGRGIDAAMSVEIYWNFDGKVLRTIAP